MVFSTCLRVTRDAHDAEDATQATFLTLAAKGRLHGEIQAPEAWLRRVAHRLALDLIRSRKRRLARENLRSETTSEITPDVGSDLASASEHKKILQEELAQLPAAYRMPLVLHYFGGLSRDEMAEQLRVRPNTLGVRLHRAREQLRKRLARRGLQLGTGALSLLLADLIHARITETVLAHTGGGLATLASSALAQSLAAQSLGISGATVSSAAAFSAGSTFASSTLASSTSSTSTSLHALIGQVVRDGVSSIWSGSLSKLSLAGILAVGSLASVGIAAPGLVREIPGLIRSLEQSLGRSIERILAPTPAPNTRPNFAPTLSHASQSAGPELTVPVGPAPQGLAFVGDTAWLNARSSAHDNQPFTDALPSFGESVDLLTSIPKSPDTRLRAPIGIAKPNLTLTAQANHASSVHTLDELLQPRRASHSASIKTPLNLALTPQQDLQPYDRTSIRRPTSDRLSTPPLASSTAPNNTPIQTAPARTHAEAISISALNDPAADLPNLAAARLLDSAPISNRPVAPGSLAFDRTPTASTSTSTSTTTSTTNASATLAASASTSSATSGAGSSRNPIRNSFTSTHTASNYAPDQASTLKPVSLSPATEILVTQKPNPTSTSSIQQADGTSASNQVVREEVVRFAGTPARVGGLDLTTNDPSAFASALSGIGGRSTSLGITSPAQGAVTSSIVSGGLSIWGGSVIDSAAVAPVSARPPVNPFGTPIIANAVELTLHDKQNPSPTQIQFVDLADITLAGLPDTPSGHRFFGFWSVQNAGSVASADLLVRYDDLLMSRMGLNEKVVKLWVSETGHDWTLLLNDPSFGRDTDRNLVWASVDQVRYFAVSTPEPTLLGGVVALGVVALRRVRRA